MPGFVNKERVVFALGLALLVWEATAFLQGQKEMRKPPRSPGVKVPRAPALAATTDVGDTGYVVAGRNIFMQRQEFTDLPPARLSVPPPPAPSFVSGAPAPRPAAGAATEFRQSVPAGTTIDIDTPPEKDEDD